LQLSSSRTHRDGHIGRDNGRLSAFVSSSPASGTASVRSANVSPGTRIAVAQEVLKPKEMTMTTNATKRSGVKAGSGDAGGGIGGTGVSAKKTKLKTGVRGGGNTGWAI
jgi:hypothetical protein